MKTTRKIAAFFLLLAFAVGANFAQAQEQTVKVTIVKYVNGAPATATSAGSASFLMNANWSATNTGTGSGQYSLSPTGFNTANAYNAVTANMSSGATYSTSEVKDGTIVGSSCATFSDTGKPKFALVGYSYGDTLAQAAVAAKSTTAPNFTNITSDKYVIVWNKMCKDNDATNDGNGKLRGTVTGGQVSQNGDLKVTSITADNSNATADGTFEHGLKYTFNITVPTDETHLSMKFADWTRIGGGGTIPVANNMRISSPQADNSGAKIVLTAANVYSSPTLNMTSDLDPSTPGKQVKVVVEVSVPSTTVNGNYATSYGVKTI